MRCGRSFGRQNRARGGEACEREKRMGGPVPNSREPELIVLGVKIVDGTFHSPEWHAARLASLNKSHTVTWEEFKRKQKSQVLREGAEAEGRVSTLVGHKKRTDMVRMPG
ncbi:hypothetical protein MA16_Dca018883 [Dendrobium catenatum]|uniref:Uncharacterized protein n=1 Tax=Dendrobium catenatum TaxID=906689 RepID=A0A2I0VVY9_9ASPA|nr:hypothetical protein MA16_Dca018883 [Dendrobium catenatum]